MSALDLSEVAAAKSTHRFARLSATKARAVLDLVRDLDVDDARDVLRHTERGASTVVSKVLESAVANAAANHFLDPDGLYVAECWADEGPTLRRFRPRARGRATRINKRTCHITVVVAMLDPEELAVRERSRAATRGRAADRAARVAASRQVRAAATGEDTGAEDAEAVDTGAEEVEAVDTGAEEVEAVDTGAEDVGTGLPDADEPEDTEAVQAEPEGEATEPVEGAADTDEDEEA